MNPVRIAQALLAWPPRWRKRRCALCGNRVGRFLPYPGGAGATPRLMLALDVVGSDAENFECPRCGGHDRERHLLLYLRASGLWAAIAGMEVWHSAPERRLSRLVLQQAPRRYVRCDLYPASDDIVKVDMLQMQFDESSFDMVIANHVLEHVDDDLRALSEIRRVLRPGGIAVLQTPFSRVLRTTWSDPGITSDEARLQAYGQADHVRLFGADIFERFASVGLVPETGSHAALLPGIDASEAGVNIAEPFFLFRRPA